MNLQFFKKWFANLNKDTEDYQAVFEIVNESYFDFKDPDDHQKAAQLLNMIATKGDFEMVAVMNSIANQILQMQREGFRATTITVKPQADGPEYNIDMYTEKTEFHKMKKMIENTVMVKSKDSK